VAQVEHDADVRAGDLVGHAHRILDALDPAADMRVEQELSARIEGQVGHLPQDGHAARVRRGIRGGHAVDQQIELDVAPFDQGQDLLELGRVVGWLPGRDINGHRDLEQPEPRRVERLEPVGNAIQPDMTDPVIAQFLEHHGLLCERALLGVVPIDAEGEESEGLGLADARRAEGGALHNSLVLEPDGAAPLAGHDDVQVAVAVQVRGAEIDARPDAFAVGNDVLGPDRQRPALSL